MTSYSSVGVEFHSMHCVTLHQSVCSVYIDRLVAHVRRGALCQLVKWEITGA